MAGMLRRLAQASGLRALLQQQGVQAADRAASCAGCSTSFAAGDASRLFQARAKSTVAVTPGLKFYKPSTPGFRGRVTTSRRDLWKGGPFKPLTEGLRGTGGRDSRGRVSSRHIGGGGRRVYRTIDFARGSGSPVGVVERLEYDPNRSARIALLRLDVPSTRTVVSGDVSSEQPVALRERYAYVLATAGLQPGATLATGADAPVTPGNTLPLRAIPIGMPINNVELVPGRGGQLARSAGASASVVKKSEEDGYATVRLPSGEQRLVLLDCHATLGTIGNAQHKNRKLGKAGASRWVGKRPHVRGMAMNACDHPHGGGRGKKKGTISQTPWGKPTKGYRTRKSTRTDWAIALSRHKAKKRA